MHDPVNHPSHYTSHPSGVECITIVRHMSFNLGNAIKYIWRAGLKSPDPIQDLEKAIFYLKDEIARLREPAEKTIREVISKPAGWGNGVTEPLVPRRDSANLTLGVGQTGGLHDLPR